MQIVALSLRGFKIHQVMPHTENCKNGGGEALGKEKGGRVRAWLRTRGHANFQYFLLTAIALKMNGV